MTPGKFVLGVDPSLCNVGFAVVELQRQGERVVDVRVSRTAPSSAKRRLLVAEDDARRIGEHVEVFRDLLARYSPVAVAIESPAGSQHAKSAHALGLAFGALVALVHMHSLGLVQVTVTEVKKAACGRRDASKDEVIASMERRYPGIVWPQPRGIVEHAADAVATVVAALPRDAIRVARSLAA